MAHDRGDVRRLDTSEAQPLRVRASQVIRRQARDLGALACASQIAPEVPLVTKQKDPSPFRVLERERQQVCVSIDCSDTDAARVQLEAMGWQERAERGLGRERWHWVCPACQPRVKNLLGPST